MIKPTIGRVVWYYPIDAIYEPLAAIICHVWSNYCVNLAYFDENGVAANATSVPLHQDGIGAKPQRFFCEWMPYQLGQAAKTEEALAASESGEPGENHKS